MSHNVTATVKNRLRTPQLVIIEFVLEEVSDTARAGEMLYLSLISNYTKDKQRDIRHEKIIFDLKNDKAIQGHQSSVSKTVAALREM